MDIDERLNNLTTNVELLHGMMRDVLSKVDELVVTSQTHDAALTRLENLIAPLIHTALNHEQRLRKLERENGGDTDEGEVTP